MSDTIETDGASTSVWYFTENGQRRGPITTASSLELLRAEKISGDTPVWRKGLADWQPLRTTDLGAHLQDTPPPVAPTHVNNSLVWTLAIAPIGYAILTGWRDAEIMENPYGDHSFAQFVSLGVPLVLNAALCLLDERQLKRAGYADKWLTIFGILLAPVYLFLRAKRLRQFPSYGIVWVASFIISFLMSLPGGFFLR
jgi:GYF domain 2